MALQEFKCPKCGGAIAFDSTSQKLECPYCGTSFDIEALQSYNEEIDSEVQEEQEEQSWDSQTQNWTEEDGMRVYVCNSCGGEIITDPTTAATSCPFCGNPVVMQEQLCGDLKPDLVIPFKLDKKAAKEGLLKHMSGKKLLPKLFKDENHLDEIKGIYVPFWLYDSDVDASIRYKATRVRIWTDTRFQYTETRHYMLVREGKLGFDQVPADGSEKMADDLMESIEPYHYEDAVDFQTAYLAGFLADRYDVDSKTCEERVNARIRKSTEMEMAGTVLGYNSAIPEQSNIRLRDANVKYALLPVWILNTTYKGEKYTFAMNGQTSKFAGNMPIDKGNFTKWMITYGVIIGAVVYGLSLLFL